MRKVSYMLVVVAMIPLSACSIAETSSSVGQNASTSTQSGSTADAAEPDLTLRRDLRTDKTLPQSPEYEVQFRSFQQVVAPYMTDAADGKEAVYDKATQTIVITGGSSQTVATLSLADVGITVSPDKIGMLYAMRARGGDVLRTCLVIDGQTFYEDNPNIR